MRELEKELKVADDKQVSFLTFIAAAPGVGQGNSEVESLLKAASACRLWVVTKNSFLVSVTGP